jgi:hypothetical protein
LTQTGMPVILRCKCVYLMSIWRLVLEMKMLSIVVLP